MQNFSQTTCACSRQRRLKMRGRVKWAGRAPLSLEKDVNRGLSVLANKPSSGSWSQTYSGSMARPTPDTTTNPWSIAAMEEGGSPWDGKPLRIQPCRRHRRPQAHSQLQTSLHDPAPAITSPRQQQTANSKPVYLPATMEEKHEQRADAQRRTRATYTTRGHCASALYQCIGRLS